MQIDSTALGFHPWWTHATQEEIAQRITRLEQVKYYCKGRAADLRPHVEEHILFLKGLLRMGNT